MPTVLMLTPRARHAHAPVAAPPVDYVPVLVPVPHGSPLKPYTVLPGAFACSHLAPGYGMPPGAAPMPIAVTYGAVPSHAGLRPIPPGAPAPASKAVPQQPVSPNNTTSAAGAPTAEHPPLDQDEKGGARASGALAACFTHLSIFCGGLGGSVSSELIA